MKTKRPKLAVIIPQTGYSRLSDAELLQRLNAVYDGMNNNPAYPNPPVEMPVFRAAIDAYTSAVAALDGGTVAIVNRDKRRTDAILMYRALGHYVELQSKNDMLTFVSSGFITASASSRISSQQGATPAIDSVGQGNTGQLVVRIRRVDDATHYD